MSDKKQVYIFHSTQRKKNGYFSMENKNITALSATAFQILCYVISKPKHWRVVASEVQKSLKISEKRWSAPINELQDKGYVNKITTRNDKGKFETYYYFYENPSENNSFHQ